MTQTKTPPANPGRFTFVLLGDDQYRLLHRVQRDAERRGDRCPEIPVAGCEDDAVTSAVDVTDTDMSLVLQLVPGQKVAAVETYEGGIEPLLRLSSHIFQGASEEDNHTVSSIRGLADQRRVGCSLAQNRPFANRVGLAFENTLAVKSKMGWMGPCLQAARNGNFAIFTEQTCDGFGQARWSDQNGIVFVH